MNSDLDIQHTCKSSQLFSSTANLMCIVFISPAKSLIETLHITRLKIDPLRNCTQSTLQEGATGHKT